MGPVGTAIKSHGEVESESKEVYGKGKTLLRIGNGGAGATCLLAALAEDYLQTLTEDASIDWVCNHSRNTQLALLYGFIDVALTYELSQAEIAASEGWSITAGAVFHDHFVLAGPASDPAGIKSTISPAAGFSRLANAKAPFHSRADDSATMWKEREIWSKCHLEPWNDLDAESWYRTSRDSPSDALVRADAAGAYLLTDRSTLLRQTTLGTIASTTVFWEPTAVSDVLMNTCHALYSPHAGAERKTAVARLLQYLFSDRGQEIIASFGREETGFPLFAAARDGLAKSYLKGGISRGGRWVTYEI